MNVLIAGYPYIRESFFNTFKFYPEGEKVFFVLPGEWKVKKGKVIFRAPNAENVYKTKAYFYHSEYPLFGGVFKGFMPGLFWYIWKLRRKVQLLYSPSEPILLTTLYQGVCARLFGLKHVIFMWENIPYRNKFKCINGLIKRIIIRLNLFFCDGIVCGSKKAREVISSITDKPTAVIPLSGVDPSFFNPSAGNKIFGERDLSDKIVFSFVGAVGYRKGIHLILDVFKDVLAKVGNAHLIIAGSGSYEKEIDKLIVENKLTNHVTRFPWIGHEDLVKLLSASDIFLYPSLSYGGWEEQFGYSMAEASLMELPIISTRSGSIEEVVEDRKSGILIEPDNKKELKEAMIHLALDRELRIKMGKRGRENISRNFSYTQVAKKFHDFFSRL